MSNPLNEVIVGNYQGKGDISAKVPQAQKRDRKEKKSKEHRKEKHAKLEEQNLNDSFSVSPSVPKLTFKDIGGIDNIIQNIRELVEYPLLHPELFKHLGVQPVRGILIHGPAGCGKTVLATAIAGEFGLPLFKVSAPELVSGISGESEAKIRNVFKMAAEAETPSIIFVDEIDAITPRRETAQKEMERRIVAQFVTCLDGLALAPHHVFVLGATNRIDAIDPGLRRAGRFDKEISLGVPDLRAKEQILRVVTRKLRVSDDLDFAKIAQMTPGYVSADLVSLSQEAATLAVHRIFKEMMLKNKCAAAAAETPTCAQGSAEFSPQQADEGEAASDAKLTQSIADASDTKLAHKTANASDTKLTQSIAKAEPSQERNAIAAPIVPQALFGKHTLLPSSEPIERSVSAPVKTVFLDERELISHQLKTTATLSEEELSKAYITMEDFTNAIPRVQPSVQREGFNTKPNVKWADVGALDNVREEMIKSIVGGTNLPSEYGKASVSNQAGILLYGPPGCGKTLIAKAVAGECGANFIGIKGPQLLNKYVGEAEKAIRQLFQRAQSSAPCIIFFDEIDALCSHRVDSDSTGSARLVNQLLTEMDGLEARKGVYVVAATNRPHMIDTAMLRPGRLEIKIRVDLPTDEGRVNILEAIVHSKRYHIDASVDLREVGSKTQGFSGADLAALLKEAAMISLIEGLDALGVKLDRMPTKEQREKLARITEYKIKSEHIDKALKKVSRSVTEYDRKECLKFDELMNS